MALTTRHKLIKSLQMAFPRKHAFGFAPEQSILYSGFNKKTWQTVIRSQGLGLFDSAKVRELGWPEEGMNFPKTV
jgi:hypothetical protein